MSQYEQIKTNKECTEIFLTLASVNHVQMTCCDLAAVAIDRTWLLISY